MADGGAEVLGVDPNPEYISMAQQTFGKTASFEVSGIGHEGDLARYPAEKFDFIFMSDALLFYFVPNFRQGKSFVRYSFSKISIDF